MIRRTALAAAIALVATPAFATTYTLDPGHTQVVFSWNHLGYSNPTAQFGVIEGTLDYDAADPTKASVKVTIDLDSVNSNVEKLDAHLANPDFFDAAKFPKATFTSTKVEKGAAPETLKVTGDLDLHGVKKPVVLDVTINKVGEHPMTKAQSAGFDATATIKRTDWGISKYAPAVSDDIKIRITTEAVESKAWAEMQKPKS
jgi:polyisoprenoid-binding protein YceI